MTEFRRTQVVPWRLVACGTGAGTPWHRALAQAKTDLGTNLSTGTCGLRYEPWHGHGRTKQTAERIRPLAQGVAGIQKRIMHSIVVAEDLGLSSITLDIRWFVDEKWRKSSKRTVVGSWGASVLQEGFFGAPNGVDEEGEEDDGGEEDEKGLGNHRISGAAENTWYSRASSVRDQSAIKDDAKLERAFLDAGIYSFDLEDLLRASAEVLGKGSVGTSYKAVLEEGTTVVVKRLKDVVVTKREFEVQMEGLRKVNHENIVPLRAFYYSKDEKLLVYDFMPAGSLSALLHEAVYLPWYLQKNAQSYQKAV
ncbi:hypothetical protein Syun_021634 [Stephania yunnanensis]|uniref:Protein kinase domain-containing protein n=1 Tax=Stephania yunnanensis TaxID=152371 RepID=A0AAP0IGC8_9MAGN